MYLWYKNGEEAPIVDLSIIYDDEPVPAGFSKVAKDVTKGADSRVYVSMSFPLGVRCKSCLLCSPQVLVLPSVFWRGRDSAAHCGCEDPCNRRHRCVIWLLACVSADLMRIFCLPQPKASFAWIAPSTAAPIFPCSSSDLTRRVSAVSPMSAYCADVLYSHAQRRKRRNLRGPSGLSTN